MSTEKITNKGDIDSSPATSLPRKKRARRPRSLTTLRLEVIAERARKIQRLKQACAKGDYQISSSAVSKSILASINKVS